MENVKLFLSQKSQFDIVKKIRNKNRTRASLFQSSYDGKREYFFMWPRLDYGHISIYLESVTKRVSAPSQTPCSPKFSNLPPLRNNLPVGKHCEPPRFSWCILIFIHKNNFMEIFNINLVRDYFQKNSLQRCIPAASFKNTLFMEIQVTQKDVMPLFVTIALRNTL